ncbi:twitching motility protein PilT [Spirochaetia bacterium]|nr:twitching motility protein PilT [Spirochaetia bacterium]
MDASAIMGVITQEPVTATVVSLTKGKTIVSPRVVSFEIANGLTKMMKMKLLDSKDEMIQLFRQFKLIPIKMVEIDIEKALEIAWDHKLYAYDAFYLETAKRLNLPLVTFDSTMFRVGLFMGLTMLGGKYANN